MITSNSNPRVKQIVQWRNKAKERAGAGIFLTEGFKMFGEAPQELIREVYISVDILRREEPGWDIREKLDRYETVSEEVFRKMSDTLNPQGILCVMERPKYTLEGMLAEKTPLLMMLENLQDPGNLGTIVRTAEGAGATGIIMGSSTVDIYNPKTIRATMSSGFHLSMCRIWAGQQRCCRRSRFGSMRPIWTERNTMMIFPMSRGVHFS